MITILPADEAFLQSIEAPDGVDAMVLRDGDGSVFGHALFRMAGERVEMRAKPSTSPRWQHSSMASGVLRLVGVTT